MTLNTLNLFIHSLPNNSILRPSYYLGVGTERLMWKVNSHRNKHKHLEGVLYYSVNISSTKWTIFNDEHVVRVSKSALFSPMIDHHHYSPS